MLSNQLQFNTSQALSGSVKPLNDFGFTKERRESHDHASQANTASGSYEVSECSSGSMSPRFQKCQASLEELLLCDQSSDLSESMQNSPARKHSDEYEMEEQPRGLFLRRAIAHYNQELSPYLNSDFYEADQIDFSLKMKCPSQPPAACK